MSKMLLWLYSQTLSLLMTRWIDIGYTDSVDRFCRDAVDEKLARAIKDYETLGKLLSDDLSYESDYTNSSKWTSYNENIGYELWRRAQEREDKGEKGQEQEQQKGKLEAK